MPLPAGFERAESIGTFAFIAVPRAVGDRGAKPISDGRAIRAAMRTPVIVLNFKTYPEILGKKGWELAKRFAAVEDDTGASIVLAPPTSDLAHIATLVHVPVIGLHGDVVVPGLPPGW